MPSLVMWHPSSRANVIQLGAEHALVSIPLLLSQLSMYKYAFFTVLEKASGILEGEKCLFSVFIYRWECSSVGRASDRHASDAGSIPRCGKGVFLFFFSQSQLSVQSLSNGVRTTTTTTTTTPTTPPPPHHPRAVAYSNMCVHIKNPVVLVRVR